MSRFRTSKVFSRLLPAALLFSGLASQALAVQTRIASWNMRLGVEVPGQPGYDEAKKILSRVDADIIGFQEVTAATLTNFYRLAQELGYAYPTNSISSTLDSGNRLAVMSRYPITLVDAVKSPGTNNELTRLPLVVSVDVPGTDQDPTVVVVHYKCCDYFDSAGTAQDRFRRAVEIRRTTEYLASKNLTANSNIFVLGDYNLVGSSNSITQLPTGLPSNYRLGQDVVLPISYSTNPNFYFSPYGLSKTVMRQADGVSMWTYPSSSGNSGSVLDYIVTSSAVAARGYQAEIYNSAKDAMYSGLPKAGTPLNASTSTNASDHLLVFGDFLMDTSAVPVLVLNVAPSTASEAGAINSFTFTVRIPEAPGPNQTVTVNLANSDPSEVSLSTTSVTFTQGVTAIDVFGSPIRDNVIDGDQLVAITASAEGYASATSRVTVTDVDFTPGVSVPAIALDSTGFYSQNFNALPVSGTTNVWSDGLSLPGWYAQRTTTNITILAGPGNSTSGGLYSFGESGSNDRALGSVGGGAGGGSFAYGVQFKNTSSNNVVVKSVSYAGEQWRIGTTNSTQASQAVAFFYRKSTTELSNISAGTNNAGWTALTNMDFLSPVTTAPAVGALNGNALSNRSTLSNSPSIVLQPGEHLMLRWSDIDHDGGDHGLAIDDFSIFWEFATAAPVIGSVGDKTMDEDSVLEFPIDISDADTPANQVNLSALSSNTSLLPSESIFFLGAGAQRRIYLTPSPNAHGSTTITVTASDGQNTSEKTFLLTVNPVNDPPYISDIEDIILQSGTTQASRNFVVVDPDSTDVVLTAESSNTALLPASGLTLGATAETRSIAVNTVSGAAGSSVVTLTASDGSLTATKTFSVIRPSPQIFVDGTLSALTTVYGTPSTPSTFAVSGNYLASNIQVVAPTGFEVSADGTTYGSSITLTPVSETLPSTIIYLRLAAAASAGANYNAQTITVSGGGASPAMLSTAAGGNSVAPKTLTIAGLTAADKIYDGTTEAIIFGTAAYAGLVNNESFAVSGNVAWAFPDKSVGNAKILNRTGNFATPSPNYVLSTQPVLSASITTKQLTVSGATVTTKPYDGATAATITGANLFGIVGGDAVTASGVGTFNDANAGENKPVTANLVLGGADASNYSLVQPSLTGTITKANQTITFAALPSATTSSLPFSLTATTTSALAIAYSSSNPAVATVTGSVVTIVGPGTTTITASQDGNTNFNAATPATRTLTVNATPSLIAGWDFETTTNGGTAAASNNAPRVYVANFGSGTLHLDGTNGSSSWIAAPTTGGTNQVSAFGGTTSNVATGFSTNTSGPSALALVSSTGNAANGQSIVFRVSMANRRDLAVSYATRGSASGFSTHTWSYSTNASNWTEMSVQTGRTNTSFAAINLPVITNVDGASNVFLRMTVAGATNASGNNRLDNVQIVASAAAAVDATPPVITIIGSNSLTIPVGSVFSDPGATALDAVDGPVSVSTTGSVNTAVPGTYTITYSATDAANNTATATRTVVVAKETPNITQTPTASAITVGQKLGASSLIGGIASVPGVFAWTNPDENVTSVGTSQYQVTFTPSDTAYYNTATAMVSVTANQGTAFHAWIADFNLAAADAVEAADPDRDGLNNWLEFNLGRNPTRGDGWSRSIDPSNGQLKVIYWQRKGANLTVQTSTDLGDGFNATVSPIKSEPQPADIKGDYEQYEATVAPMNGRAFLRIRAIQP